MFDQNDLQVIIIGGGITGLSAAYSLQLSAPGIPYALIEASKRLGGKVVTEVSQDFVIEGGPDSFFTQRPEALALCKDLGLESELVGTPQENRAVFVLRNGRLHRLPVGMELQAPAHIWPLLTSSLFTWQEKLRLGWERFVPPKNNSEDESLGSFVRRRLGAAAVKVVAEPMLAGVHVAEAESLSMEAAFPRFLEIERKYGSLTKAAKAWAEARSKQANPLSAFMTLRPGLGHLVETLAKKLKGQVIMGQSVVSIVPLVRGNKKFTVRLQNGLSLETNSVILATPADSAARVLELWDTKLASDLMRIQTVSSATVSLAYRPEQINTSLRGTGFLVPRGETRRLLACTWTSSKFPGRAPEGIVLLRAVVGGHRDPSILEYDDETLSSLVTKEVASLMKITGQPLFARVFKWPNAHPQYEVGHLQRIYTIEQKCPQGLILAGAPYRGLGLPNCIAQGQAAASAVVARLRSAHELKRGGVSV